MCWLCKQRLLLQGWPAVLITRSCWGWPCLRGERRTHVSAARLQRPALCAVEGQAASGLPHAKEALG